jgi:hypothetical protein
MVGYSSLQDPGTGEEHECLVYWRQRYENEASSQSTAPERRRSEYSKHSEDSKGSRDPKDCEKLHHHEESNRNCSTTANSITTPRTDTHPPANMDVAIRHPVFLIVILVAIWSAQFRQPRAVPIFVLWILLKFVRMVFCITIVYLTKGSPTEPVRQDRSCSPDHNDTKASVIEKVPTILRRRKRFVAVKTTSGERHISVTDWMMWKDKDAKWPSDSRSENKGASESVSGAEESISDDGIAREEKEGQSSSSTKEKTPYSEPPLLLGV